MRLYRASGRSARRVGGTRSELTPRVLLGRMAAAAPDVGIAAAFAWVAVSPALWDAPMGTALWRAALMEFWAIHAGGFLMVPWIVNDWNLPRRALYAAGLVAAYSVVLGIASLTIGAWWPIVTFWALTCNRALDVVLRDSPSDLELGREVRPWAGNVALFCIIAAVTGLLANGRQEVYIGAAVYFLANAVSELGGWWWLRGFER